ncbi:MAG: hypothetical protein V1921_05455 [Candidatus Altiarchaeota archaeon]
MMELSLDLPRSEVRRRLEIYRLMDLERFLQGKRISIPTKSREQLVEHILLKPKLCEELVNVLYLREGLTLRRLEGLASEVGVMVRSGDGREAIALKIWLRKPEALARAHTLARAENTRKWKFWERKEKARFERKPMEKMKNALKTALLREFRRDAFLADVQKGGDNILLVVRHTGRGVFREDVRTVSYALSSSEIILDWDWKRLRVSSASEGAEKIVNAFSKALGYESGFIPEDAEDTVMGWLIEAQQTGKFPQGQIVRLKGTTRIMGVEAYDVRGKNFEKILNLLDGKLNTQNIEIVEWLSKGRREGYEFKTKRWIS